MVAHKPSSQQASVTQPLISNLCSWKPKHWLICPNLLMLSPQLQTHTHTHTLTVDGGVYQRSCLEIQERFFSYTLWYRSEIAALWKTCSDSWQSWICFCGRYSVNWLSSRQKIPQQQELSLRNIIWAPVIRTDSSIGSRQLSAIIQSCWSAADSPYIPCYYNNERQNNLKMFHQS